ncbi:DUF192 domain-containing protein [Paracoccus aerodenitrificans]|uniref:DUF192 domain-containing protein n=1 Tax=Paracoccus aerodenitrificans TaxID=3017781 RepID=UPI0022F03ABC|nr:DUF192 domain-containing protein [Paracoccus aerodenitrificans]WBU63034.1 DUF192 domain-containing protein [Paracoccus aerodenitrificans]
MRRGKKAIIRTSKRSERVIVMVLRAKLLTTFACVTTLLSVMPAVAQPVCSPDLAVFPEIDLSVNVEIADNNAERAQGLMNRESLAEDSGMLFIFEQPRETSFWMKNTLIPLDIVFMDETGTIRHVHPNAIPMDLTPIPGAAPGDPDPERLMVLEVAGGEAQRMGLKPGIAMAHPRLDQSQAAQPCQ